MTLKKAFKISVTGYALIVVSALILTLIWRLATGYFPSFLFFTMGLVTLRTVEIHNVFVIAPLIVSFITLALLSKTRLNERFTSGLSLSLFYFISSLAFFVKGAGEFSYGIAFIWILWVFVLGYTSSAVVTKK
jgi:hypothetical protein